MPQVYSPPAGKSLLVTRAKPPMKQWRSFHTGEAVSRLPFLYVAAYTFSHRELKRQDLPRHTNCFFSPNPLHHLRIAFFHVLEPSSPPSP